MMMMMMMVKEEEEQEQDDHDDDDHDNDDGSQVPPVHTFNWLSRSFSRGTVDVPIVPPQ